MGTTAIGLAAAHPPSELVLRGIGTILSSPVDRVSVAPRRSTPCLVGKLCLRLGLAADVLKLVEHPSPGLVNVRRVSRMNAIAVRGSARNVTAHATAFSRVMGESYSPDHRRR
jgi:hypothetical protein